MSEQISFIPKIDPDELIAEARAEHNPVATICLFSGGHDSSVLAHRCRRYYGSLAFVDTGTAVPGVREFVESYARWLGKPLRILESGDAYRRAILGHDKPNKRPFGFPDPAGHQRIYNAIKQPQIRKLGQELKGDDHRKTVFALTGIRRAESQRRKARKPMQFDGNLIYVNPLIDWSDEQMQAYRLRNALPESEVAALLHRSGECNCGAFAGPDERQELETFWPEWFERTIGSLEQEAANLRSCRWGDHSHSEPVEEDTPMCSDCQLRLIA